MNLNNVINNVFLTVDTADQTTKIVNSIWPFISFLMFLIGMIIALIGFILASAAKKEWSTFYAPHDQSQKDSLEEKRKALLKGRVVYISGIVMLIASFFIK